MPYGNDYSAGDEEDEDALGDDSGGGAVSPTGAAPKQGTPSNQPSEESVPWSSFVSANSGVSDREASKLQGQVQGGIDQANKDLSNASSGYNSNIDSNYTYAPDNNPTSATGTATSITPKIASSAGPQYTPPPKVTGTPQVPQDPSSVSKVVPLSPSQNQPQQIPVATQPTPVPANSKTIPLSPSQNQPAESSWASFLGNNKPVVASAQPLAPRIANLALPVTQPTTIAPVNRTPTSVTPAGVALGANAPKDLQAFLGDSKWSDLGKEFTTAQDKANALGSQTGIQGLLQSQASEPGNSAFDAALLNNAGQKGFQNVFNQYGGTKLTDALSGADTASEVKWQQLQDYINTQENVNKPMSTDQPNAAPTDAVKPTDTTTPTNPLEQGSGWSPPMASDYDHFMDNSNSVGATAHFMAMLASPADWGTFELGYLSGQNIPNVSQVYTAAEKAGGDGSDAVHGNLMLALYYLKNDLGWSPDALRLWYKNLTPTTWNQFSSYQNGGMMARNIEMWMNANNINHNYPSADISQADKRTAANGPQVTQLGGSGDQVPTWATTGSPDFDQAASDARDEAYREGWGARFDSSYKPGQPLPTY